MCELQNSCGFASAHQISYKNLSDGLPCPETYKIGFIFEIVVHLVKLTHKEATTLKTLHTNIGYLIIRMKIIKKTSYSQACMPYPSPPLIQTWERHFIS